MRRKGLGAKQKLKTVLKSHGNMTWVSGNAATELQKDFRWKTKAVKCPNI